MKVGLIVDSKLVSKQIYDLIKFSNSSDKYEISKIIIQKNPEKETNIFLFSYLYIRKRGFKNFINNLSFRVLSKFEEMFVRIFFNYDNFFKKFNINNFDIDTIEVSPKIHRNGIVYEYLDADIRKISSSNLDLLVRAGSGILKGKILNVCTQGVISFHHGDNNVNRGGPPAFWEVYNKEDRSGFTIQILKDELDGGDVIFRGFIATAASYTLNLVNIYEKSNIFLHKMIEKLSIKDMPVQIYPKIPHYHKLFKTPNIGVQFIYIINTTVLLVSKIIRKLFFYKLRWNVSYQFTNNWKDVVLRKSKTIKNPKNQFLADPFIVKRNELHFCFMENFCYKENKGHISVYKIGKDGYENLGIALKENFHLSFPFIFEFNNSLYMCPETLEANDIRIYKCDEFPLKWSLSKILIKNIKAVDTCIFYKNEKWWILTNTCSSDIDNFTSELHLFSSNDLLVGDWKPHKKNPVIFDSLKARNGGLIIDDDKIYRIYQRQGFDFYGKSLGAAEIKELNNDDYKESTIFEIHPYFFKNILGTHTFNYCDGLFVNDFVKVEKYNK
tara:strand:- start:10989 stop:12650 length:1662 start_codon:yes stop_codon:yes gene_type:complete